MAALMMWFQDASTSSNAFSGGNEKWILIFLGVIAFSMLVQAVVYIGLGIAGLMAAKAASKAVNDLKGSVGEVRKDLKTTTDEIKAKVYPIIESVTAISQSAKGIVQDAAPKFKTVSDHIVETTQTVRDSARRFEGTATDLNGKTQRQVARVDGMVTGALDTTAEIFATIEHGIKIPAQKIATVAGQLKQVADGMLDRVKGIAGGLPFLQGKGTTSPARPKSYPASSDPTTLRPTGTTPASATGSVPLVK